MKTYSLNEVVCMVGTVRIQEQLGKITITPRSKRFTAKVGNDGNATLSENKDNSHDVKIQCMSSSQANAVLSAAYELALNSPAGNAGIVPLVINDGQGNSVYMDLSAIITGWPERTYEPESGDIEWELFSADPARFEGGN